MNKAIYSKQYKQLISHLRQARIECKLSQVQVARTLKTTQSHISKIESGQRRLDVIQLKEFAKLYRRKLSFFIP
jgi:transcriptional regulator with XRE-family HTH domain